MNSVQSVSETVVQFVDASDPLLHLGACFTKLPPANERQFQPRYLFTILPGTLNANSPPSTMNAASIYMPESFAPVACLSQPTA